MKSVSRIALGGAASEVTRLMMMRALVPVGIGAIIGLAGGYGLSRMAASFLFGIDPHDPLSFAIATLLIGAGVLVASYVPARRAARVDPMTALRAT
jgi:putative ABC transport system permease protein